MYIEGDPGTFNRVQRAGKRPGEGGVVRREITRDLVHQGVGGIDHVVPHRIGGAPLEAVDARWRPSSTAHGDIAASAGYDQLTHHPVADRNAPVGSFAVELHHSACELMSRITLSRPSGWESSPQNLVAP